MYDTIKAIAAQKEYCKKQEIPCFIPLDGYCFRCDMNIFTQPGYTVEEAEKKLLTRCPFCSCSFVE